MVVGGASIGEVTCCGSEGDVLPLLEAFSPTSAFRDTTFPTADGTTLSFPFDLPILPNQEELLGEGLGVDFDLLASSMGNGTWRVASGASSAAVDEAFCGIEARGDSTE